MLTPEDIHAEIERQMGEPVGFTSQDGYIPEMDLSYLHVRFWVCGQGCEAAIRRGDREMTVEELGRRIVAPMVDRVKSAIRQTVVDDNG